jgi:hypothetical protein
MVPDRPRQRSTSRTGEAQVIHVPAHSAIRAADPKATVFADVLELLLGAGLSGKEITWVLDIDPWSIALLRSFLHAFDAVQANTELSPGA